MDLNFQELRAQYERDGFLVLKNIVPLESIDRLKSRYDELLSGVQLEELSSIFTTQRQQSATDDYFLTSGDKVRFFLEEKAVESGKIVAEKYLAINKIGHALYELDPVFRSFTGTEVNLRIATEILGLAKPLVAQSMYICKQPFIGGEVSPHQDGTFLFTKPESVCAFWYPLEDATLNNACLWIIPGSHKEALRTRMKLSSDGTNKVYFDPPKDAITWPDEKDYVPVEVKKGSLVLIHGRVTHKSSENLSDKSRHAYTFHLVDGNSEWDSQNWMQRPTPIPPLEVV